MKHAILKAYELVPEEYVEFAREEGIYFDRWCNSREDVTDFEKLKQVILI